jgi:hypothetical protein
MPHDVFPLSRILITAVICALVTLLLLAWRGCGDDAMRTRLILALLIGALVLLWRIMSNRWYLNDDFAPGVSPSDVGSGLLILVGLLALTPLHASRRAWIVTSALIALAIFVCNVVLI